MKIQPKQNDILLWGKARSRDATSLINREWLAQFSDDRRYRFQLLNPRAKIPSTVAAVIHHEYGIDFNKVKFPPRTKKIAVRTWDFGPFPKSWARKIEREIDQIWVYSRWTRAMAMAAGISESKVKVIPLGVDTAVFHSEGSLFPLETDKTFRIAFVGSAILRKGIDILLKAYRLAFTRDDDVCLVIKDFSSHELYSKVSLKLLIRRALEDLKGPEILYIDGFLERKDLAALYRACDLAVFPYRAEGFSLPILEAMACGLLPVVPDFGACRDYCNETNSILMPVRRIRLPVNRAFQMNAFGFEAQVESVDFCEVEVETLAASLRAAYHTTKIERYLKTKKGTETAREKFSWARSAQNIRKNLGELLA